MAHLEAEIEHMTHVIEALQADGVRSYAQGWRDGYDGCLDKLEALISERELRQPTWRKFWARLTRVRANVKDET